jgi:teichuronic acid biosynthesis glycosyltransferase TuaC
VYFRLRGKAKMKVLVVTNMYPTPERPSFGIFIQRQVESLREEGVDVDVFFVNGKKNVLNHLWAFPRFWARLLTRRYDLIHSHYLHVNIVARAQFLYPLVITYHSGDSYIKWQRRLSYLINPFTDSLIAVSEDTKKVGHLKGATVIPSGLDMEKFKPEDQQKARKTLGLPMDNKLVLWVGGISRPEKRADIVQESMALLKKRLPRAELVLVTNKPPSSVPAYMNACDVLFLVSDKEGSPNVIKEAMACNLPIVSTPVGDVPEMIGDTEGCYLCSQDPDDVAQKLELALQWGKRTDGREKIGYMDIRAVSRMIISVYEDLLRRKKGRGLARLWFWQKKCKTGQVA